MIFSSITFIFYFLPPVLLLYRYAPCKYKNLVLLIASLFFYAWGEPKYIFLMLFSTGVDYTLGLCIGQQIIKYQSGENVKAGRYARYLLFLSLLTNLSLLVFFKYSNLLLETGANLLSLDITPLSLTLPVGISFYTFQTMSYSIDVYRGKVLPQKNLIDFAAYVTLFPQLIAGPIVRYESIEKELSERHTDSDSGIPLFIIGLAQKVLLANNMGLIWEEIRLKNFSLLAPCTAWIAILAYAFQIYFDFCGYSNMAIGLGRIFGFHFPENFNKPYSSGSITEFWQRWHISLSTWFKEYVYIPLGGNRFGPLLQLRNILIVWLLTGIWHGASWNFLFWGLYFAALLIFEKLFLLKYLTRLPSLIRRFYTMSAVLLGWVLFVFDLPENIIGFLKAMFSFGSRSAADSSTLFLLLNNAILFLACVLVSSEKADAVFHRMVQRLRESSSNMSILIPFIKSLCLILVFLLSIAYIVDSSYNPFLYFRF